MSSKITDLTKAGLFRAIMDDLDADTGGAPKTEAEHDELIEKIIAEEIPVTEQAGTIYYVLQWLEEKDILIAE